MTDQLLGPEALLAGAEHEVARPSAPTGWAIKQRPDAHVASRAACLCGAEFTSCAGCGQPRCLSCDPYLSDDCRWSL